MFTKVSNFQCVNETCINHNESVNSQQNQFNYNGYGGYGGYGGYNSYGGYGIGNMYGTNMFINQVLTMTIIPLITTTFTVFLTNMVKDIKKLIEKIFNFLQKSCDDKNLIQYELYNEKNQINDEVIHLIWHINKTCSLKEGNMIYINEIISNTNTEIDLMLCPIEQNNVNTNLDNDLTQNTNNFNTSNDYMSNLNKAKNTKISNNSLNYTFVKINDKHKKFYYGVSSSKLCIMSKKANIEEIAKYIMQIKLEYDEYKSEIGKNIMKEKQIYIQLYNIPENNNYGSNEKININPNVMPLIWYMNKKKIITQGVLLNKSFTNNNNNSNNNTFIFRNEDNGNLNKNEANENLNNESDDIIIMPFIEYNEKNDIDNKSKKSNSDNNVEIEFKKKNNTDIKIELEKYIYCECMFKKKQSKQYPYDTKTIEYIKIFSTKYSVMEINDFLQQIETQYNIYIKQKNKIQHIYTFISTNNTLQYNRLNLDTSQTFEHLFFSQKDEILNDIDKFLNIEYYKKFGMKRKLGYLFCGPIGCGKSALVSAITNKLSRSLKSIPISLIKTNSDFEKAYLDIKYDAQLIKNDEVVITFDEIDSIENNQNLIKKSQNKQKDESHEEKKQEIPIPTIIINNSSGENSKNEVPIQTNISDDKLNIGIVLSKIDGNEEQDGIVIIATCNDIDNLDPALYRNGRFKLVRLSYVGAKEIAQMIEKYCEIKVNSEQYTKIRNDKIIQTLNIKHLIANYLLEKNFVITSNDIDDVITRINKL